MVDALKRSGANVTYIYYSKEGHGLSKPEDIADWLRRLEAFLKQYNPA
jgi:dipeptidyl aminopeptidase/acylaminoacyl peptidase